jgi:ribonuclease BN (tRNA processing enzyme)
MHLIILGTSAGFAGKDDGCSSYLLCVGTRKYLIDVGPGSLSSLQNHINFRDLDAILISHLHADHVSDLYTLRFAVSTAQKEGSMPMPFPIYMPDTPADTYRFIHTNIGEEFDIQVVTTDRKLYLHDMSVQFLRTQHPVLTHAMRFEHDEKVLVYTTDTAYFDALVSFSNGADILLAEATLQESERELEKMGHMTAKSAGLLAERARARTLLLTHIWPEYDRRVSLEQAQTTCSGTVKLAERGMEISI